MAAGGKSPSVPHPQPSIVLWPGAGQSLACDLVWSRKAKNPDFYVKAKFSHKCRNVGDWSKMC